MNWMLGETPLDSPSAAQLFEPNLDFVAIGIGNEGGGDAGTKLVLRMKFSASRGRKRRG